MSPHLTAGREPAPPVHPMPLQDLVQRMQQELLLLQNLSVDAQLVMSFALQEASLDAGQWSRAQSLDLISQRLEGLATLLAALTEAIPPSWTVDATDLVRNLSLSDLVNRILARPAAEAEPAEIELF